MVQQISGNSNTPIQFTNTQRADLAHKRQAIVNSRVIPVEAPQKPLPNLNNAPIVRGGGLSGGGQMHHPSSKERFILAKNGKPLSLMDIHPSRIRNARESGALA